MTAKSLEERIQRLEDIHEIQNLMSKYEYLHTAGMHEETVELFARKTPGAKVEVPSFGIYDSGIDGVRRCYAVAHVEAEGKGDARRGNMNMHALTTPVIQVAGDGKTAKAVWISPGHETHIVNGKAQAYWAWCKYGCDFVKEDGAWKIWHLRVYGILITPYEKSWVEETPFMEGMPEFTGEAKADRPANPPWIYRPDILTVHDPVPPEPYETFDEKTAYVI